ncbi:hypothetical protein [Streptomyces sp. VRA16 Mangrove soil]|uniref:hypothetical protein n=1 Tax=Streptomyces sp. VRA16 Mangrove soil TaxID=2817434 RepID=UPI001A9E1AC4|nr:hypothetical protein [Streptomyces sp. VRA16 Mangrove soil]MBO1337514.1 hypothetical protein [Streptomyces sp. VRA16 Mangrove soil]
MFRTVHHPEATAGPADIRLPLAVARALRRPVTRAPEVAPRGAAPHVTRASRGRARLIGVALPSRT